MQFHLSYVSLPDGMGILFYISPYFFPYICLSVCSSADINLTQSTECIFGGHFPLPLPDGINIDHHVTLTLWS